MYKVANIIAEIFSLHYQAIGDNTVSK